MSLSFSFLAYSLYVEEVAYNRSILLLLSVANLVNDLAEGVHRQMQNCIVVFNPVLNSDFCCFVWSFSLMWLPLSVAVLLHF